MHPDILRELGAQRDREMRDRARQAMFARRVSKARRAMRRGLSALDDGDNFVVPAIPDYVDGSFRTTPADDKASGQPGRVPTTGRAA